MAIHQIWEFRKYFFTFWADVYVLTKQDIGVTAEKPRPFSSRLLAAQAASGAGWGVRCVQWHRIAEIFGVVRNPPAVEADESGIHNQFLDLIKTLFADQYAHVPLVVFRIAACCLHHGSPLCWRFKEEVP